MPKKKLEGIIVSNKMEKTVVVKVETLKVHPKYRKRYKVSKNYKAHSEKDLQEGDKVIIQETKPMSKDKRWKVL